MHRTSRSRLGRLAAILVCVAVAACGAGSATSPNASPSGASGANACPGGASDTPFLVDGDTATRTYFTAQDRRDVVFVRYDGHSLIVLDGCRDELAPGALGAYEALDEKRGPVETLDVADGATLCAKLPLASGLFGARVRGGEGIHLSYYVSGTRKASRAAIDEREISRFPGCRGATHFVAAFDVGAFELASSRALTAPEQKVGDLARCAPSGDMGRTPAACMVPIRVALRPIAPATSDAPAPSAQPSPITAADDLETTMYVAQQKLTWRDGPACLAALDAHDKLDQRPHHKSTDPTASYVAMMRAECMMLAGQCEAGKALFRAAWVQQQPHEDATRTQTIVDVMVGKYCQGSSLTPRDRLLVARMTLQDGAWTKTLAPAQCMSAYRDVMTLRATVKPRDDEDSLVKEPLLFLLSAAPACLAKAGDCDAAFAVYREVATAQYENTPSAPWFQKEANARQSFYSTVRKCRPPRP